MLHFANTFDLLSTDFHLALNNDVQTYEVCRKLDPKAHKVLGTYLIAYGPWGVFAMVFASTVINVGGAVGSLIFGVIASRLKLRPLLIAIMLCAFVMVSVFGLGPQTLLQLSVVSAATGFFTNSAVVGLYALMAQSFPAEVRASGTGVVIGIGRGGAALGPIVAGYLFQSGYGLFDVSVAMGFGAVVAAIAIFSLGPVLKKYQLSSQV